MTSKASHNVDKLRRLVVPEEFGVVGDGVANDTAGMVAFFNHCIATGAPGHINKGTYLIQAGQLVFDNGGVDKGWPEITTDGHDFVTFKRLDATNAPMITFTNAIQLTQVGKYWNGGCLGGITFDQNNQAKASNQHGISMRGVWATKMGWMRFISMGGSGIYLPEQLFGGTNPDPYAVTFCVFEGVQGNFCDRYAFENRNFVGFNNCEILVLRVIQCELGGLFGFGSNNIVRTASMGTVKGWAFDDGNELLNTGGSSNRFYLEMAELDDVQNGFKLNKTQLSIINGVRFVHRYNFSILNPSQGYWPRTAISICGGTAPIAAQLIFRLTHRIEPGGTKLDLGKFLDLHNAGGSIISTQIEQRIIDNAGLSITNADLFSNFNINSRVLLTRDDVPINDASIKVAATVRSATTVAVPETGYGAIGSKITFATEIYDAGNYYSTADSWFVVPYEGLYRLSGRICLTMAVGTRVRLGFSVDSGGSLIVVANSTQYQVNVGAQHYAINQTVFLSAGDKVFLVADQNTGAPVNLSAPISNASDLIWSIEAV